MKNNDITLNNIKNSLTICKGYFDMYKDNSNKEYLKHIEKEINNIIENIDDLDYILNIK